MIDNQSSPKEVGVTVNNLLTVNSFSQGIIQPYYDSGGTCSASAPRSGPANCYNFYDTSGSLFCSSATNSATDTGHNIFVGTNRWCTTVDYDAGTCPIYDSNGGLISPALPSGTTTCQTTTITGYYPWFYGTSVNTNPRPTAGSALLTTGICVVASSNGTVNAPFNTTGAEWTWVAIPATSTVKTVWYVTALNNGTIGGVYPSGNKYPSPTNVSVNSPTALWSGINYNFYISELPSIETNIEFRNS
jgi:hypothetical protein